MAQSVINLDHNATTPVSPAVWDAMRPYMSAGNPASAHSLGRHARKALEDARERIAARLDAQPDEVILTSGATEANNLAIFGLAGDAPGRIFGSGIEHPCVSEPIQHLAKHGFLVEDLPVGRDGVLTLPDSFPADTRLVVMMRVNHETGAIQPIVPPGAFHWHTDAAQAVGKQSVSFRQLDAATLAFSGHKFGAPPGIGALLVRRGVHLRPMLLGGHQQRGLRPGTEPVALAVGLAAALDMACDQMSNSLERVRSLKRDLLAALSAGTSLVVNGPSDPALGSPYVLNVSFPGVRADALTVALDLEGVACATGSACSSGSSLPSPVLRAMGVRDDMLRSAVRFSFSPSTNHEEIETASRKILHCLRKMRDSSRMNEPS